MQFQFIKKSGNAKTGPMPVTYSPRATCGDCCSLKDGPCYGETGPVSWNWNKLDAALRGNDWDVMIGQIDALPFLTCWRHNVLGDLPHNDQRIDSDKLYDLIDANTGKLGFTYTHHDMGIMHNRNMVRYANDNGFTINLSADNLAMADELHALNIGPVAVMVEEDARDSFKTPAGNSVVVCPAAYQDDMTCARCKMCARQRETIIGLPVHGARKNQIPL